MSQLLMSKEDSFVKPITAIGRRVNTFPLKLSERSFGNHKSASPDPSSPRSSSGGASMSLFAKERLSR